MVSVIIPAAREGLELYRNISSFRKSLERVAGKYSFNFELLVVTDVFHGETLKAMGLLAKRGVARSLLLTRRIGKGGSIKNAVRHARGDYIVLLDADIPVKPETIAKALRLAAARGLDVLVANRVYRTHTLLRRMLSVAYNTLVRVLFKTGLRDHQAGFKVLSRRAAWVVLAGLTRTDGLAYDTEVVVWVKSLGLKLGTVDVAWLERRRGSTIPPFRALLTMLADLLMLRLLTLAGKHAALARVRIGRILEIPSMRVLGPQYMTVVKASGAKKRLLDSLRTVYAAVAFKGGR